MSLEGCVCVSRMSITQCLDHIDMSVVCLPKGHVNILSPSVGVVKARENKNYYIVINLRKSFKCPTQDQANPLAVQKK